MEITDLIAVAVLIIFAANFIHWKLRGTRFLFFPASGWLRVVFMVWSLALIPLALLAVVRVIHSSLVGNVAAAYVAALQLYSIRQRQARPLPGI